MMSLTPSDLERYKGYEENEFQESEHELRADARDAYGFKRGRNIGSGWSYGYVLIDGEALLVRWFDTVGSEDAANWLARQFERGNYILSRYYDKERAEESLRAKGARDFSTVGG